MNTIKSAIVWAMLLMCAGAGGALAETQFLCSITESVECSDGVGCGPPEFGGVVPPSFIHVDVERKIITLLAPAERRGEENSIDVVRETADGWILAGMESKRAWTLYLTGDGNLTLAVTMDGTTWTAFGRCMPAAHAKP